MLPDPLLILASLGLAFGFSNKILFLHTIPWLQGLISCPYCTGFWFGWPTWVIRQNPELTVTNWWLNGILWSMAVAFLAKQVEELVVPHD